MHPSRAIALTCALIAVTPFNLLGNAHANTNDSTAVQARQTIKPTIIQAAEPRLSYMAGTAFAVSTQGHLLTADHAVRQAGEVRVYSAQFPSGVEARVVAQDAEKDLALLKIAIATRPMPIAQWNTVPTGLEVYALGYPQPRLQGSELKITSGLINAMEGPRGASGFFQFSAPVQRGNSGGPLLSPDGLVVGLVQAKLSVLLGSASKDIPQNVNFAIQSQGMTKFLSQHQVPILEAPLALNQTKRPHELFASAQPSVFSVQVVNAAQANAEAPVPDEMRAVLISLPKDEQARLYGAFKAGFTQFKVVGSEYVMVRSGQTQGATTTDGTQKFEFILSLAKPRALPDGQNYRSMVLHAQLACGQDAMIVTRQEYKDETFGNGKTLRALKRKEDSTAEARPIKSEALKEFFKSAVCSSPKA
jgi:S1-C subfamily serine protease